MPMRPSLLLVAVVAVGAMSAASACAAAPAAVPAPVPKEDRAAWDKLRNGIDEARLRRHVEFLASPDRLGRAPASEQNAAARAYITAAFKEFGLKPVWGESFEQPGEDPKGKFVNIAGLLPGATADAEIVVVIAHYDHLGVRAGKVFAGADDNAAAVALLLETARILAADKAARRCAILFLCPDAEETGLRGSAYFVKNPPAPLARFRTAIVMDLVGTDPSAKLAGRFFVMGTEGSAALAAVADAVPGGEKASPARLSIGMVEAVPFAPGIRAPVSDYDAFRNAGRPFVFLSAGRSPKYHTPEDLPETLNFPKMTDTARYLAELTVRIAEHAGPIDWEAGRIDLAGDLVRLQSAIAALTAGDPAPLHADVAARLKKDAEVLAGLAAAGGKPTAGQIRSVQMIALRVQLALWKPTSTISLGF